MTNKLALDEILATHLGQLGRYQKIHYVLLGIPSIFASMQLFSWSFVAAPLKHRCLYPGENDTALYQPSDPWYDNITNLTTSTDGCNRIAGLKWRDQPPFTNSSLTFESCKYGYTWDHSDMTYSAVDRWSLVCERDHVVSVIQALYYVGQMFGSLFFGVLADQVGRKPMLVLAILIQTVCGACVAVAPWWQLVAFLRPMVGFTYPGVQILSIVLGAELVGPKYRVWSSIGAGFFWAIGEFILVALSYPLRDYRYLQLAISLPGILLVSYWWIFSESPRWLLSQGKYDQVHRILARVAKWNGKGPLPNLYPDVGQDHTEPKTNTAWWKSIGSLFRTPRLRNRTIITLLLWIIAFMIFNGLSINPALKGGNIRTAFLLSGLSEIPSLLYASTMNTLGRKFVTSSSFLLAGACLISTLVVPDNHPLIALSLVIISKAAATAMRMVIFIWTPEHYPTIIRNTATGVVVMIGPLGGIAASYFSLHLANTHPGVVALTFGASSILAGLLALFLPETAGEPLTETIEEAEALGSQQPFFIFGFKNQKVAAERT